MHVPALYMLYTYIYIQIYAINQPVKNPSHKTMTWAITLVYTYTYIHICTIHTHTVIHTHTYTYTPPSNRVALVLAGGATQQIQTLWRGAAPLESPRSAWMGPEAG